MCSDVKEGVAFSIQPDNKFTILSMWKPLLLCLLVPFQSSIFLVSMFQSRLFAWDLYDVPIKNYPPFFYFEMDISVVDCVYVANYIRAPCAPIVGAKATKSIWNNVSQHEVLN